MAWWAWLLLILAVVFLLIMLSSIKIRLHYSRMHDNDSFSVHFRALYGMIQYKLEMPVIQFKGIRHGVDVKAEQVNEASGKMITEGMGTITQEKVVHVFERMKEILQATLGMKEWIKETMAHVTCTDLRWDTRIGIGDAPETAITTGVIWTLKSSVLAYLFQFLCRDTRPRVRVMPQYNQNTFSTDFSFDARIRMTHAMWSGIRLVSRVNKVEGGFRTWQNVFTKPLSEG